MGQGSPLIFFKPPLALPIMIAALIIFFWPLIYAGTRKLLGETVRTSSHVRPA